jgi:hypothetical protein
MLFAQIALASGHPCGVLGDEPILLAVKLGEVAAKFVVDHGRRPSAIR